MFLIKIITGKPTMELAPDYECDLFTAFYTSDQATIIMLACLLLVLVFAVAYHTIAKDLKARTALLCWSIAFAGVAFIILIGKRLAAIGGTTPMVYIIFTAIIAVLCLTIICARLYAVHKSQKEQ